MKVPEGPYKSQSAENGGVDISPDLNTAWQEGYRAGAVELERLRKVEEAAKEYQRTCPADFDTTEAFYAAHIRLVNALTASPESAR